MISGYLFILPWLIGAVLFFINPFIQSLRLSFSKITKFAGFKMKWIGLENYAKAFLWDVEFVPMFITVVRDTFINTIMIVVFSLIIAILINKKIKFRGFFRGVFFLPVLLGTGYVMEQLLGMNAEGPAMEMARGIAIPAQFMRYLDPLIVSALSGFLNKITYVLWKSGVQIILFLAGLQGISSSLYEAARVDSATEWEMFWKITLPMISPVILLNIIYTIIDSFTDASNPIVDYVLNIGFKKSQFEYSAAISWIYFVFVLIVCIIVYFAMKNKVYDTSKN
jgi:ABC-type sugar transport system permease subunit